MRAEPAREPSDRSATLAALAAIAVIALAAGPVGVVVALVGGHALYPAAPKERHWLSGGTVLVLAGIAAFTASSEALLIALPLSIGLFLLASQRRAALARPARRPAGPLAERIGGRSTAGPRAASGGEDDEARRRVLPPWSLALSQIAGAFAVALALFLVFPASLLVTSPRPPDVIASAKAADADPRTSDARRGRDDPDGARSDRTRRVRPEAGAPPAGKGAMKADRRDPGRKRSEDGQRSGLGMGDPREGDGLELDADEGEPYDPYSRARLFRRAQSGFAAFAAFALSPPSPSVLGLLLALLATAGIAYLFLPPSARRRLARALARRDAASRVDFWDAFLALLERRGIAHPPGETGRALAARAALRFPPEDVRLVVETFYRVAYGGAALTLGERRRVLDAVGRLERVEWERKDGRPASEAAS